jgi:hypothetical protein
MKNILDIEYITEKINFLKTHINRLDIFYLRCFLPAWLSHVILLDYCEFCLGYASRL